MIDIRGMLRRGDHDLTGMFRHNDGHLLSGAEVRELLFDELEKGRKVLPACDPAKCPDFDYSGGGCPGHSSSGDDSDG